MTQPVEETVKERISFNASTLGKAAIGILGLLILYSYWNNPQVTTAVLASSLRQSTPLVLGALCGLIGERSGIINIGIEGQMLLGAFVAFLVNVYSGNLLLAIAAGLLTGVVMGLFLA
ncbi:MAG TPA: hypothetical protein EYP41_13365, partial [Anaerolineae bacterium]|nr:hypothetical protein [Anaerolineae bacterium]